MPYNKEEEQAMELVRRPPVQNPRLERRTYHQNQYAMVDDKFDDTSNQTCASYDTPHVINKPVITNVATGEDSYNNHSKNSSKKDPWQKLRFLLADTWIPEIGSLLVATATMVSIIIVLRIFDGQLLPDWPYGITLNTLISLLVTLNTSTLMVPISKGISQLKWVKFSRGDQDLIDLEVFDQASRGPFGSLVLITTRTWSLSSLGAIITILALAANAFTQQSIIYVTKSVVDHHDNSTTSSRAKYFGLTDGPSSGGAASEWQLDTATEGAFLAGVLFGNKTFPFTRLSCPSGNCAWAEYTTLGACATVADVSSQLLITCAKSEFLDNCQAELPGVPPLSMESPLTEWLVKSVDLPGLYAAVGLTSNMEMPGSVKSIAFQDILTKSLVDFYVLRRGSGSNGKPTAQAIEINLQYCVQTLESAVEKGQPWTRARNWYTDFEFHGPPPYSNLSAVFPGSGELFSVGGMFWGAMANFSVTQFTGSWSINPDGSTSTLYPTSAIKAIINAIYLHFDDDAVLKSLQLFANNLATSLTNHFRTSDKSTLPAFGNAYIKQTFVSINWGWIAMLAFITGAAYIFIIAIVLVTTQAGCKLWKDSTIALLQVLEPDNRPRELSGLRNNSTMREEVKHTTMQLQRDKGRWKLVPAGDLGSEIDS